MTAGLGKRRLMWRDLPALEREHKRQRKARPLAASNKNPFTPRVKPKRPQRAALDFWSVQRAPGGRLVVVDRDGVPVLAHPSAQRRLEHAHLIAAAPELRDALDIVAHRLWSFVESRAMTYSRDAALASYALQVLATVAPRWEEVQRVTEHATRRDSLRKLKAKGVA